MSSERMPVPGPEALIDELEQALGLLSTLAPTVEVDGVHPLRWARAMHADIESYIDSLDARIHVLELESATAREALRVGTGVPTPLRQRIIEAWRVLRGIVNVASVRHYAYCEAARADREMYAHTATLQRVEEERKAIGLELHRLREELAKANATAADAKRLLSDKADQISRSLAEADRHTREHIARAEALNKRIQQMEDDAKRELLYWYNPKAEIGCRWVREHQYPPGTVLEKRNAANQAIARSIDGGQTWHEVRETVVMAPENPA